MRIGISGTHGVGKSTLAADLCRHLPGHAVTDEPYNVLVERGHEFAFPPSTVDLHLLTTFTVDVLLTSRRNKMIFDRTPLDYLAYLAAMGADPAAHADEARLRDAFATLDIVLIVPIDPASEAILPEPELPRLRRATHETLLDLAYGDPFDAWGNTPLQVLDAPLSGRLDHALRASRQCQQCGG